MDHVRVATFRHRPGALRVLTGLGAPAHRADTDDRAA